MSIPNRPQVIATARLQLPTEMEKMRYLVTRATSKIARWAEAVRQEQLLDRDMTETTLPAFSQDCGRALASLITCHEALDKYLKET